MSTILSMQYQYNPLEDEWFLKTTNDNTIMLYNSCVAFCGPNSLSYAYEIHKNGGDVEETFKTVDYLTPSEIRGFLLYSKRRLRKKIKVLDNDDEISKFLRVFHNKDKIEAFRVGYYIRYQCKFMENHFAFFKYDGVFYEVSCDNKRQVLKGLLEIIKN